MRNRKEELRIGIFESFGLADAAVARLIHAGVAKDRISVVCPHDHPEVTSDVEQVDPGGSHAVPAAVAGGTIGSILGGLTAAVGVAATGGTGLLVVGPLFAGAAGLGVVGGFIGAMSARGLEPDIADFYDQALWKGQVLVSVEPPRPGEEPSQGEVECLLAYAGGKTMDLHVP